MSFFSKFMSAYSQGYKSRLAESRAEEDADREFRMRALDRYLQDETITDEERHRALNEMGDLTGYKNDPKIFGLFTPPGHAGRSSKSKLGDLIYGKTLEQVIAESKQKASAPPPSPQPALPQYPDNWDERLPSGETVYDASQRVNRAQLPAPPSTSSPQTSALTRGGLPPPPSEEGLPPANSPAGRKARAALAMRRQERADEFHYRQQEAALRGFTETVGTFKDNATGKWFSMARNPATGETQKIELGDVTPMGTVNIQERANLQANKTVAQRAAEVRAAHPDWDEDRILAEVGRQFEQDRALKVRERQSKIDLLISQAGFVRTKEGFLKKYDGGGPLTSVMYGYYEDLRDNLRARTEEILSGEGLDKIPPGLVTRAKREAKAQVAKEFGDKGKRESLIRAYMEASMEDVYLEQGVTPEIVERAKADPVAPEGAIVRAAQREARRRAEQRYNAETQTQEEIYELDWQKRLLEERFSRREGARRPGGGTSARPGGSKYVPPRIPEAEINNLIGP